MLSYFLFIFIISLVRIKLTKCGNTIAIINGPEIEIVATIKREPNKASSNIACITSSQWAVSAKIKNVDVVKPKRFP